MAMKHTDRTDDRRNRPATVISMAVYQEAVDEIHRLEDENDHLYRELEYLTSYLQWADQMKNYQYFEEHAIEVNDPDQPFPFLDCPYPPNHEPIQDDLTNGF